MKKILYVLPVLMLLAFLVYLFEFRNLDEVQEYLNGITLKGTVVSKRNFDNYITVCVIQVEHSSKTCYLGEDDRMIIEICDTTARIIYRNAVKIGRKFFEENYFPLGSKIEFNVDNDGWIRELDNGKQVNRIRAFWYKRPIGLDELCKCTDKDS